LKATSLRTEPGRSAGSNPSKGIGVTGDWASTSRATASINGRNCGSSRESAIDRSDTAPANSMAP
jgi:hypothetical protein